MLRAQLAEYPDHLTGHVVLGQALFDTGALADARVAFEAARALDPGNRVVLRQLGEIASLAGDREAARRWFERLRAAEPYADDVGVQLGGASFTPPEAEDVDGVAGAIEPDREVRGQVIAAEVPTLVAPGPEPEDARGPELLGTDAFEPLEFAPHEFALHELAPVTTDTAASERVAVGTTQADAAPLDPVVGLDLAPSEAPAVLADADVANADVANADVADSRASRDVGQLHDDAAGFEHITNGPFATETMAGLLAAQGHTDQAIALYERLTADRPGDAGLRARLGALRGDGPSDAPPPVSPSSAPVSGTSDAERGAVLAAAFADPYADLSFDRFFAAAPAEAAGLPPSPPARAATPSPPTGAAAASNGDDASLDTPDPMPNGASEDADLARFDTWLRDTAA